MSMNNKDTNATRKYEIHRLAVHSDSRGRGVGKLLLQTAEEFIQCKEYTGTTAIYATTPEIMEAANSFYSSHAYEKVDDTLMGTMNIRTYRKILIHANVE